MESQKKYKDLSEPIEQSSTRDPEIIIITPGKIKLVPNYWNYSFLINFPLLILIFYLLEASTDSETILLGLLAVIIVLYTISIQLMALNKCLIDKENKSITVFPNFFLKMIGRKNKIISNGQIKRIYYKPDSFSLIFRRFVLKITLENNQTINLISSREEAVARKLVNVFSFHF